MTRPSPIIVGFVALSILILGLEIYGIQRSRRRAHPAVVEEPVVASPPAPTSPASPVVVTETRGPAPPAPPPAVPGGEPLPAEPDRADTAASVAAPPRPLFVAPAPDEVIRDADEHAFNTLKLPDATRAAIRRLNQEHAASVESLRNEATASPETPRTRRAALEELLGPEAAQRFSAAEQAALKRLHNRYRWQSLHGVPPGGNSPQPSRH